MLEQGVPKQVDHAARRAELTAAVFRVVRAHGTHAVSVRSVAAEARTSPSALRHYFSTQDELLAAALQAVVERAAVRVRRHLGAGAGLPAARAVLAELLPLDDERRDEVAVQLAFTTRAHTDPALRTVRDDVEETVRAGVGLAVGLVTDLLAPGTDPDEVAARTYHLVDGLALHGAMWPDRYPPEHQRAVLDAHLATVVRVDALRRGRTRGADA